MPTLPAPGCHRGLLGPGPTKARPAGNIRRAPWKAQAQGEHRGARRLSQDSTTLKPGVESANLSKSSEPRRFTPTTMSKPATRRKHEAGKVGRATPNWRITLVEEWRDIPGFDGAYQVSNTGRVRLAGGRLLQFSMPTTSRRYCSVSLSRNGVRRYFLVHRLVAAAFVPEVPGRDQVNHIDGDRLNNHASNLEWCTQSQNNLHARRTLGRGYAGRAVRAIFLDGSVRAWSSQLQAELDLVGKGTGIVSWALKMGRPALGARWERA